MLTLRTKVRVTEDGTLEASVPATALPPGEHEAVIVAGAPSRPRPRFRVADLPVHDVPWEAACRSGARTCTATMAAEPAIVVVLRLQPSPLEEARNVAGADGVSVNQFITVAVAEKPSAP